MLKNLSVEENFTKKVDLLILFLETNNFTLNNKNFYYSTPNEKISEIKNFTILTTLLNTNLEKIKILNFLFESLFVFFSEEKEIELTKFKWNFKTKQFNTIIFSDIKNYIIKTNQKMIIKENIKKNNNKMKLKWTIKVLNKNILKNNIVQKIMISILKSWKISKNLFYFLLSKSKNI